MICSLWSLVWIPVPDPTQAITKSNLWITVQQFLSQLFFLLLFVFLFLVLMENKYTHGPNKFFDSYLSPKSRWGRDLLPDLCLSPLMFDLPAPSGPSIPASVTQKWSQEMSFSEFLYLNGSRIVFQGKILIEELEGLREGEVTLLQTQGPDTEIQRVGFLPPMFVRTPPLPSNAGGFLDLWFRVFLWLPKPLISTLNISYLIYIKWLLHFRLTPNWPKWYAFSLKMLSLTHHSKSQLKSYLSENFSFSLNWAFLSSSTCLAF